MTNCQTCKHWMRDVDTIFSMEEGWCPCTNKSFTDMIDKSRDDQPAGWIYTSPDFACIYHESVTA
jgi:hypothetical protein